MITDKEQKSISPDKWETMTFAELIEEKNILMNRYYYTQSIRAEYAKALLDGINRIDSYIEKLSK